MAGFQAPPGGRFWALTDTENDVAIRVCRGYASVSSAGEIADFWRQIKKPIFAYYLGDFDPSGFDLERDLREKIERYGHRYHEDDVDLADDENFIWQRLGVTAADFAAHDLIRLPVKQTDKRAAAFIERHGNACAEIDAIPPNELRRRVTEAIDSHVDAEEWNRLLAVEQAEQETLNLMVEQLGRTA